MYRKSSYIGRVPIVKKSKAMSYFSDLQIIYVEGQMPLQFAWHYRGSW